MIIWGVALLAAGAILAAASIGWTSRTEVVWSTTVVNVALGLGGSLIATALVARIFSRQLFGVDAGVAIEALRDKSHLTRCDQRLDIRLEREGDGVRVTAQHKFTLLGAWRTPRSVPFAISTDVVRWGSGGGFAFVQEPDGTVLEQEKLDAHLSNDFGRVKFEKSYKFYPRRPVPFRFETFAVFRREDRLIWTVEHLSADFTVCVVDQTGLDGQVSIKVNHHREEDIVSSSVTRRTDRGSVLEVDYLGEVLPFQGFELQWAFASAPRLDSRSDDVSTVALTDGPS